MGLKVSALRCLDVRIQKDDVILYEGNVDNAPEELKDSFYKTIDGAYPVIITL